MRILVIGGGLFGSCIAYTLANANLEVDLVEQDRELMQKASFNNHNRIHMGYHYLRSISTARQSLEAIPSFLFNFGEAVVHQFPNYYALAKNGSKTNKEQFEKYCNQVGIDFDIEYPSKKLLNHDEINSCYRVPEPVFDFNSLLGIVKSNLNQSSVNIQTGTSCIGINQRGNGTYTVSLSNGTKEYDVVINATYAGINTINEMLGISGKQYLYEEVAIPVFRADLPKIGMTVMDGPFGSIMPHGTNPNEFLLYHVTHSVFNSSHSVKNEIERVEEVENEKARIEKIYQESIVYYPFLQSAEHLGIKKAVRVVDENSDDARLSEIQTYPDASNYYSILAGKVVTCVQVALNLKRRLLETKG